MSIKSFLVASVLILLSSTKVASAISLEDFKRNVTIRYPGTELANNFDKVMENAVVTKIGDGSRKLIVFIDPYCTYCVQFEKNLKYVDNVTIYTLLYPLGGAERSTSAIEYIWCSEDRSVTLNDWFVRKSKRVPSDYAKCETPISKIKTVVSELKLYGTPALIFSNGMMKYGAPTPYAIEDHLGV